MRFARWTAALGCAVTVSCTPSADAPASAAARLAPADADAASDAARDAPPEQDGLWRLAAAGDPLDLARLADREGALGLLAEVRAATHAGREETAARALPHAADAELALGQLCALGPERAGERLELLLLAVHEIVAAPLEPRERLAPEGVGECRSWLERVARAGTPSQRDLARSALSYAESRGAGD